MILNFCLIHFMPGDPVDSLVPRDPKFDVALKWKLYEDFHLNDSILEQLATYMWNAVTLEWGTSYIEKRSVEDIILTDLRWTMLLVGVSTVFTILIGMIVGAYAAYRRRGAFDIGSTALLLFFYGMPVFWFAMILQWSFTHKPLDMDWWPQLPAGGYYDVERFGSELHWSLPVLLSVLEYLIVPSMVLTISYIAGVSLVMRSSLIDTLTEDYVMTAKSKGLTEYQVLRNHALPNGMPPMIALIAMDVAFIIGGAYQVEYIFNYPGIGYRTIKAINELDFPLLQFIVVIGGVAVVLANFVADLMLIYIDPRIKIT
jgi:peptide/nickel transport system permease protein